MADSLYTGSLNVAWNGSSPAAAPAGSVVQFDTGIDSTFGMDAEGTFTATFILEGTIDGIHWFTAQSFSVLDGTTASSTLTAPGRRTISCAGLVSLRARCSAFTSGAVTLIFAGTPGGGGSGGGGGGGGGGGPATIADGADVAQGTTTDAGIITDTSGTVIGFLRGAIIQWVKILVQLGIVTETAPATDTASSGLNGRLQRIAQRLTTLLPQNAGRLNVDGAGGTFAVTGTVTTTPSGTQAVAGDVASGTNDSGNPVKQGYLSAAHGTAPTTVAGAQRVNAIASRNGVQFVAPGHPNNISNSINYTGAQTNAVVLANTAGTKLVISSILVQASAANTVNIAVGIGLAQTVTPPSNTSGRLGGSVAVAPGSGFGRKTYQAGADGDQLLVTSTGAGDFTVTYEAHTTPT